MLSRALLALLPTLFHGLALGATSSPKIATAWYAGWHADSDPGFPLSQVSWEKYTHLTYAFAETTSDVRSLDLSGSEPEILPQFVAAAHANGVKAKVSIGGWTGSLFWSSAVASAANRTLFVQTLVDLVQKYDLDGLDFDWEYPNVQGIGCNTITENDTANFLAFIQELRANEVGAGLILSAATAITPFADTDGNPSSDVSAFSKVLDYIAIMNYDINGPWSAAVAANAPLNDTCAPAKFQAGSAVAAINAWTAAGMPRNQIVLGVPSYGHSFAVTKKNAFVSGSTTQLALFPKFNAALAPAGDAWDDEAGVDECGNFEAQGGVIEFWGLIQQGYLNADGTPKAGVPFLFDTCSQTLFVYNETTKVMISFDNAQSFAAKGNFIKSMGLAGFAMWEAGADSNDILLDSIRTAAGF
ncbi:glycoside hydrolase family 18 protein [Mycena pura]|uniref:Glycoside hydrolase family 18 protein n=1 Tax=Mycena pura TaxID=153505 RepID=A0AAD6YT70_9AGAR|nr:glycoside hydrolase family 18 protein [Mycena pura]